MDKQTQGYIMVSLILFSVLIMAFSAFKIGAHQVCTKSEGVLLTDGHCVNYSSLNYCVGESDGLIKSYPETRGFVK